MKISKEENERILKLHESYRGWNGSLIKEQDERDDYEGGWRQGNVDYDDPRQFWDEWWEDNNSDSAYYADQVIEFIEMFYDLTPLDDNPVTWDEMDGDDILVPDDDASADMDDYLRGQGGVMGVLENKSFLAEKKAKKSKDSEYDTWCKEHGWENGVSKGCADDALDSNNNFIRAWALGFIMGNKEDDLNEELPTVRRSDRDMLRRRPYSPKARFKAGL